MKHALALMLVLFTAFASPQSAPAPILITARGCTASTVAATLAPQWTAAITAAGTDATKVANINALEATVNAKLAPIIAANPQQLVTVFVNTSQAPSYVLVGQAVAGPCVVPKTS